ncbi:carbohydrate ABC transporter permease [Klenkia brasiliensis]|uniref:Multiple sugar transport system permease protein n=1 Tax=Klenkia brasiliensis TaxID=333142 RepID=A0A1G7Q205_9ACTN|nr:carbohydrate ABC transporter permease [Klenkia brasiliensis]SDF92521.1 multiple sugar transport system permease protein [Klenkia brasiliensis]
MTAALETPPVRTPAPAPARRRRFPVGRFLAYAVLVFFALVYVYPFVIQVVTSFKTNSDATNSPLSLLPDPVTTAAFGRLFDTDFALWGFNSVWVSLLVTLGRVFLCSLAGYALARLRFRGRSALFTAVLAVMAVPSVVLLIPKFLVLNQLGIYDTPVALFLPLVADAAGVFIMKQFFESVPASIEEAARIDGAGTFRIFWSVVLPMARPALITLTILSFQASWNELPHFIVASQDRDLYTLTKGVATLTTGQLGSGNQFPLTLGAALLMTLPVAVVFFVFQRYFVAGANEGAVKG